ncbi:MAG: ATP-dependent zinc metalloprotease FtsH [Bacilli bacterium]|nr:ATP-dependent zinc metalloprotease FtsH [Bacilli bacterium]MDD4407518.1 ATP-dependent zinc metalloprotease FtsH [Bacilli bacterium]
MKNKNYQRQTIPYILLFMVIISVMIFYNLSKYKVNEFTYNEFITELSKGTVEKIEITEKTRAGVYFVTGQLKEYSEMESFKVNVPLSEPVLEKILVYISEDEIEMVTTPNPENSSFVTILVNIIPTLLLIGVMIWLFTKIGGSNKNSMDFGRSRAKLNEEGGTVKFTDVAGLVEEKQEVSELIDFLKHPKKFQKLGARIPKGVLLVGPPGTGKTLLAKAVAGEANVPFYYISGSDFVELFVGVGASRVRDMFKQAKQTAPCLIFIDEIDAVGRQRGTGLGGGHDEREQTLNQLLTEMDGFGVNEGIIIIAATNRPDVLDPALLRPGRFDRQVTVSLPDQKERESILGVHARGKIFDKSVNLENLSKRTPGFSGADLENLLNEAALLAVRRDLSSISMNEIDEATDRVLMGPAKESRKITDKEKKLIAIHESGHAVIGIKLEYANEVHKITIIPRGHAGGYTMMLPKEEKFAVMTKDELLASITSLLSGRVAEELFLGQITTGASDDFRKATSIARSMVTEYGMSDLGPVQFEHKSEGVFLGRDYNKSRNFSDTVALEIDQEVRKIIDSCYKKASKIIKENEDLVMLLTDKLMEKETLTREEIIELVETGKLSGINNPNDLKAQAKKFGIRGYTKMTEEELINALDKVKSKKDTN